MKTPIQIHSRAPADNGWIPVLRLVKSGLLALALVIGCMTSAQTITTTTNFNVGIGVPDATPSGLASAKTVSTPINYISGLKVNLKLSGTWNGDLFAYLTHSSGYTVLLNRVGKASPNGLGYGDSGFDVTFDDGGSTNIHVYHQVAFNTNGSGAVTGVWQPDGRTTDPSAVVTTDPRAALLASFNGIDPNGEWVLFVADMEAGDVFTLDSWGLEITGYTPPSIVSQPVNTNSECSSGTPTFSVVAAGSSNLVYQWQFAGTNIPGATDSSLTLNNPTFAAAGNYDVVISNNYGALTSSIVALAIQDTTPPVLNLASLPDAIGQCSASVTAPTATDGCDGPITATTSDPLNYTAQGDYTVHWTYTDSHGNVTNQTQAVHVHDTQAPTVLTKNIDVNLDASGHASIAAADVDNGSTDNCAITNRVVSPSAFTCANLGANTVTLTVTDVGGNSSSQPATVTIHDLIAPTVLTKNIDVNLDATGHATIAAADVDNGSTDNCSITNRVVSPSSFDCTKLGANTVTLTVTDESGNTANHTATVTVHDVTPPALTCPADMIVYTTNTDGTTNVSFAATATDLCSAATVTYSANPGSFFPLGTNTVTVTAKDDSNNSTNCSFTVIVIHNDAPVASGILLGAVQNHPRMLPLDKVLDHSSDIDTDSLSVVAVSANSTNGGTVILTDTNIIYTPVNGFTGADSFTYTINDGRGATVTAIVQVQVLSATDASRNMIGQPTLVNGSVQVRFAGIPGYQYNVERSADGNTWTAANGYTVPASGIATYTDSSPLPAPYYYRTAQQ